MTESPNYLVGGVVLLILIEIIFFFLGWRGVIFLAPLIEGSFLIALLAWREND